MRFISPPSPAALPARNCCSLFNSESMRIRRILYTVGTGQVLQDQRSYTSVACRGAGSTPQSMVYDSSKLPVECYTPSSPSSQLQFQSPLPYVVAGLAAMIFLILFALFVLACSFIRREYVSDVEAALAMDSVHRGQSLGLRRVITVSGPDSTEFPSNAVASVSVVNTDCRSVSLELSSNGERLESQHKLEFDKVAVIMAGEDKPTYLAQPKFFQLEKNERESGS